MKLEKMVDGMRLHTYGTNGTIMRRKCSWPIHVVTVNIIDRRVLASWNGNPPRWYREKDAVKWRKLSHWEAEEKKRK